MLYYNCKRERKEVKEMTTDEMREVLINMTNEELKELQKIITNGEEEFGHNYDLSDEFNKKIEQIENM